jgi:predicted enzyme related to lactoylglutathione lyase
MHQEGNVHATITWFYYDSLAPAAAFYEESLQLSLVLDQGWARIYRINKGAYVGIVSGDKGSFRPQPSSAVLLTLVVEDVSSWYQALQDRGVPLASEILDHEDIRVRCFFLKDPGGYTLEIQQFLAPDEAQTFAPRS